MSGWVIDAAKKPKSKSEAFNFLAEITMGDVVEFLTPYKGIAIGATALVMDSDPAKETIKLRMEHKKGKSMLTLSGKDVFNVDVVPKEDLK